MASYIDKTKINTAITDSTKFDLSCDHITTGSFFTFNPVYIREMVPGEHIKIKSEVFTRLQPLTVPTFGRCNVNVRGFFVPMRTVWKYWNQFIVDTQATLGQSSWNSKSQIGATLMPQVPYMYDGTLMDMILMQCDYHSIDVSYPTYTGRYPWGTCSLTAPAKYDYVFAYSGLTSPGLVYVTLDYYGRQAVKILESIGYKIACRYDGIPGSLTDNAKMGNAKMSIMPILSLAKIYVDWYVNSQYYSINQRVRDIESFINSVAVTNTPVDFTFLARWIDTMLMSNYDTDYFVSAWDNPTGPTQGLYSNMSFVDITNNASTDKFVVTNTNSVTGPSYGSSKPSNGTPFVGGLAGGGNVANGVTTEYVLHALHGLTDYMKRHQLAGARVFDRYLARFGKVLSPEKQTRSLYLGSHHSGVQFGDVMATGNNVGEYAGKGIAYSNGDYEYSSDEYGYLFLVSTITPAEGYYQGVDRHIMHLNNTDFWTPEFDNLGVQALSAAELYMGQDGSNNLSDFTSMRDKVFGFVPRYGEYKIAKDRLTGDFARNAINKGLDAWHMFRTFKDQDFNNSASAVSHSYDFTTGQFDGDQYNRIFTGWDTNTLYTMQDMFWMIYHFDVVDYAPMKSLYDTYEFEDKGKTVTEEVNGVKLN